jgi:hypothetical protein
MSRTVLLVGLDPHAVPGVDARLVDMAIAMGQSRFEQAGIAAEQCLVKPDDSATPQIVEQLASKPYDVVVVGGGLRKPEDMLELFETVINLIHRHAPQAAIAFNTNPVTSLDAVLRWLPKD